MSSAMVGNGYPPNYNTYNSQPSPSHGQNLTTPRRGVFYRLVSPDGGLPLGQYEEQRKYLDEQRQRDYLKMMSQKEKQEYQKREEEKVQKQVRDQKAQMQKQEQEKKLYNYNKVQKQLQEERRKDYDEFVKMKEEQAKYKQPPTPPGGLNVGHYEMYRKRLKEDLVNEYQASLKQKEKNPSPRRAPTPPNGLDIVTQDERTRMAREKQRQYGQELQRQTQEQMLQKIHNNIPVIDRSGQQPAGPNQYNHFPPQQRMMAPPPQHRASPPPRIVPSHPPPQSMSPPPQHSQQHQSSHRNHQHGTPAGSQSPPPRHRSHATPQRTEHGGYFPEFNGKHQSPLESRDGHRPPPHPRRYATPDRPDWARGPQRQNGTPTARSSHRRDDRQTPSYWNAGVPVKSPATTPSTRTPSTRHSNRTLTPKDSQDMVPDIHLESFRKDPVSDRRKEERNREYNKFLDEEHNREQQKREKLESLRKQPAVQPKYDNYSNSDNHERHRHNLDSERRGEYQSFLSKNQSSREPSQEVFRRAPEFGLPLDNRKSNELRRQQEKDRNQEYRKFLEGQKLSPRRLHPPTPEEKQGLPLTQKPYDDKKAFNEKQRNMEYNQYLAKSGLPHDKMSLKGSAQQSSRQANGHHSGMEPRPPMKRHPSKKHDREVAHRLEEEKKKKGEVPRRQGDPSVDEKNMFSDMGKAQEAQTRRMQENARQDYKNYVDHAFPEGLNRGQPSFAAGKQPPDSWYSAQPPTHRYSPPRDFRPEQNDQKSYSNDPYTERLQQARANEAMYRRHDHEMNGQGQRAPPPRQEAPYALH